MSVRMTHPDLPDQPISVSELAVPHYGSAGWEVADEAGPGAPASDAPATADAAASEPEADPKTTTPRRRGTKETEQ